MGRGRGRGDGRIAHRRGAVSVCYPTSREGVMSELLLDAAGRRHSPATLPAFHAGRPPRNKGMRYPPIRPRSRRSSPSCAAPATASTSPAAWPNRRAVARRPSHSRGARTRRGRARSAARFAAGAARQGRPPPRGRHGRLGLGAARAVAAGAGQAARRAAVLRRQRPTRGRPWRPPPPARSCGTSPARPACGDASRRTNCATPTP